MSRTFQLRAFAFLPAAWMVALTASCGGKAVVDGDGTGGSAGGGTTTSSTPTTTWTTSWATTSWTTTTPTEYCSSHDECAGGVCIFWSGQCAPACTAGSCDACEPGTFCEPCASSSCPSCSDCRAACVPITAGRCDENDPCSGPQLCAWTWGTCLAPCGPNENCGGFAYCDGCATSSCCGCDDCVAACMGGE